MNHPIIHPGWLSAFHQGWGSGEWSELRYCPRVVQLQQQHLQLLLDAGPLRGAVGRRGVPWGETTGEAAGW